jgi:serine/threonine protein kinase
LLPDPADLANYFPQLEILELLGQGGMGAVYKARQVALERVVALKILTSLPANDPGFAERFMREARALARLSHPHIVAVHEFGQTQDLHYLIMEYVDGPSLRQIERAARLTPPQALRIIPQICEALQFAHDEGVVHRDIKPENILLDRKGRVKIADFGLAKIFGRETPPSHLTGAKDVMGTPHYMAPEQIERPQEVDHRADIYSLGVVFYEMLTGELPLGRFASPSRKADLDVRLDQVVLRTLEKEPDRRYQQASQVKTDVEAITHAPVAAPVETPASATSFWPRGQAVPAGSWQRLGGLAGALALLVLGFLAVLPKTPSSHRTPPAPSLNANTAPSSLADIPKPAPLPPVVIKTVPESGAAEVDPALGELQVTFSAPMKEDSWSWTKCGEESFPEQDGQPRYRGGARTCVCPVRLKPGRLYAVWLNTESAHGFQDRRGQPALPYLLIFETRKDPMNQPTGAEKP